MKHIDGTDKCRYARIEQRAHYKEIPGTAKHVQQITFSAVGPSSGKGVARFADAQYKWYEPTATCKKCGKEMMQ